jgi:hypothetical protein
MSCVLQVFILLHTLLGLVNSLREIFLKAKARCIVMKSGSVGTKAKSYFSGAFAQISPDRPILYLVSV